MRCSNAPDYYKTKTEVSCFGFFSFSSDFAWALPVARAVRYIFAPLHYAKDAASIPSAAQS
ncbi:hypothetical protein HYN49_06625 [Flavobacterium pallidum]|uniref:Uncharacterized protein n=1 Tax=Flavobacterium pallidum TaxID=2172098 RepID=A0A2S1SGX5_9FLAO|nr:hypothetical protein HYN49_06625 [Flavobacterium pallidum]